MSTKKFSFFFTIENSDKYIGSLEVARTRNSLDAHGNLLCLSRLPSESGPSYWKRLMSVFPLRGGANVEGLIHGITRDLGLEEKTGVIITPIQVGGKYSAPDPLVEITSTSVILYSNYSQGEDGIDQTIDIFDKGSGYLLSDLVSQIMQSSYFVAELGSQVTGSETSAGLIPCSSMDIIQTEYLPAGTFLYLKNQDIIPGTLRFTEDNVYSTELSPALASCVDGGISFCFVISTPAIADGEYYVDYSAGTVISYTSSSGNGSCRYAYRKFPLRAKWSPVSVYSLRDTNYRTKVFEYETMPDNSEKETLVTDEGRQVYTQIFDKSPSLWGK
jgi:hypothetical protein